MISIKYSNVQSEVWFVITKYVIENTSTGSLIF